MDDVNYNSSLNQGKIPNPSIKDISEEQRETKHIEGARFAKPTLGKKLKKTMGSIVADDISQVFHDLNERVIVPSIRNGICNTLVSAVTMIFNGGKPVQGPYGGYTAYNNVSRASWRQPDAYDNRSAYDKYGYRREEETYYTRRSYLDVEIPTYAKALEAIHELYSLKSHYPAVRVSDYFSILELSGEYTDNQWGWYDLPPNLAPTPCGNGCYYINLPKPVPIK